MNPYKFFLVLNLILCLSLTSTYSQKNVISAEPIGLFWNGNLRLDYERVFSNSFTYKLGFEFGEFTSSNKGGPFLSSPSSTIDEATESYSIRGWGFLPEFRYYPIKKIKTPKGLFFGIFLRYRSFTEKYKEPYVTEISSKGNSTNLGISSGYKFIFGRFVLEPLIAYGTSSIKWDSPYIHKNVDDFYTKDLDHFGSFRFELNLGIALGKKNQK
jgi:hypothetical protein